MRWRLIVEEYGPELLFIPGQKNVVADVLSRMGLEPTPKSVSDDFELNNPTSRALAEAFAYDDSDIHSTTPITYKLLHTKQQQDKKLLQKAHSSSAVRIHSFCGGDNAYDLLCQNDKIIVPVSLQQRLVEWYH
ncbi:hypothetical protein, partial [Flagellimonas marinaquae]